MLSYLNWSKRLKFQKSLLDIEITEQEWEVLKRGARPQSMDQKWLIFFRDGFLNFHRGEHTLYKTKPDASGNKLKFRKLYCRRGIEPYYSPHSGYDESGLVTKLIQKRLATPADEPWFGWDPRYPRTKEVLEPDFTKFESK